MGGIVFPPCSLASDQAMVGVMDLWIYASMMQFQDYCSQCPWVHIRPLSTHTTNGDSWLLTGKNGSVSCGNTTPISWVLVYKGFACSLQESVSLVCGTSGIKGEKERYTHLKAEFLKTARRDKR